MLLMNQKIKRLAYLEISIKIRNYLKQTQSLSKSTNALFADFYVMLQIAIISQFFIVITLYNYLLRNVMKMSKQIAH